MKTICLLAVMLILAVNLFAQAPEGTKQYYLEKSRNQKTFGWVLLGGGTALAIIGGIGFDKEGIFSSSADAYGFMFIGGIVADLASIPLFISSAKNARKAASMSFHQQRIMIPGMNYSSGIVQQTVSLRINF